MTYNSSRRDNLETFIPAGGPTFQIFDSMDRPMSRARFNAHELYMDLSLIEAQAEDEGDKRTFAIGMVRSDGSVTFDFG